MTKFECEVLPMKETIAAKCQETGMYTAFGLCRIKPTNCVMPTYYMEKLEEIRNFPIRDDDLFLVSSPKCGTTWCMEMVWMIANNLDFGKSEISQFARFPHIDAYGCIGEEMINKLGGNTLEYLEKQTSPRFIKSHLPKELLPKGVWEKKIKVIFISRNAKDAAVSNYHHYRNLHGYGGSLEEFLQATLDEKIIYSPFWEHALEFWKIRHEPNILFLTYEDMKKDLKEVICRTTKFLGKNLNDQEIGQLIDHLSLGKMKNNKSLNYDDMKEFKRVIEGLNNQGEFIRSGTVGGGGKVMTEELSRKFDEWTKSKLLGTGLDELYL